MPPRRRGSGGYRGVRAWPNDTFYSEIRSGDDRIVLGTFKTTHKAARAYDAVAWRLGRPRAQMSFDGVFTREQAVAPLPRAVTEEERRLVITERDERLRQDWMWRFPQDVEAQRKHDAERAAQKAEVRAAKKHSRLLRRVDKAEHRAFILQQEAGPMTIDSDDDRWLDMFSSTPVSDTTPASSDFELSD